MATSESGPEDLLSIAARVPRNKNWSWYHESLGETLTPAVVALLEGYAGLAPDEVEKHIYEVRDTAWSIFPWPCIGSFWFLELGLSTHPIYPELLARLSTAPSTTLLDLGTCLGQDLRKLIFDGASPTQLWGSDIFPAFESAGHALFRDKDRFRNRFLTADVFAADGALAQTEGSWDVVSIFMFLHVWDLPAQKRVCARILKLLRPQAGSWVVGKQVGSVKPREWPLRPPFVREGEEKNVWRHSVETFREMWEEVGREEGVGLDVQVKYEQGVEYSGKSMFAGEDYRQLYFIIKRL
ncbi:hypothetical protein MMC13_007344 [Lambiella insularis]|nr:hypothetical protein [Lambiella insularis]